MSALTRTKAKPPKKTWTLKVVCLHFCFCFWFLFCAAMGQFHVFQHFWHRVRRAAKQSRSRYTIIELRRGNKCSADLIANCGVACLEFRARTLFPILPRNESGPRVQSRGVVNCGEAWNPLRHVPSPFFWPAAVSIWRRFYSEPPAHIESPSFLNRQPTVLILIIDDQ